VKKENVRVKCEDGFELVGTIYSPEKIAGAIMIAPATGIKRTFYNSFASHLAENGFGVICFENRGIGESIQGDINDINASLVTWGELDMPAVLDRLKKEFPNQKYHLVGHSAGGQLIGLMHNAKEISTMFNFACSSGRIRNMPYPFKISAHFFLGFFISVSNFLFGRTHSQWLGMGEPLPRKVAQQTKIKSKIVKLDPREIGKKQIGHMGFFSSRNKELWKLAVDWLNAQNVKA